MVKQPFKLIPNYQLKWNSLIQNKIFSIELPKLLNHEITPETFIKKMDALKSFDEELFIQILDKTEELKNT